MEAATVANRAPHDRRYQDDVERGAATETSAGEKEGGGVTSSRDAQDGRGVLAAGDAVLRAAKMSAG
jgi:hypothetical protein